MDTTPTLLAGVVLIVIFVVGSLLFLAWVVSPFMLYAINSKLTETNRLLAQLVSRGYKPVPPAPLPAPTEPEPAAQIMFRTLGR